MSSRELVEAYRSLYCTALRAVRFASPARYQIRDILRTAFREQPRSNFNPRRVRNTVAFLQRAHDHNGFEHKIVKNILFLHYWRNRRLESKLSVTIARSVVLLG